MVRIYLEKFDLQQKIYQFMSNLIYEFKFKEKSLNLLNLSQILMNSKQQESDSQIQETYDINKSVVRNQLLDSMDSCPYYGWQEKDQKMDDKSNLQEPKQINDSTNNDRNPYEVSSSNTNIIIATQTHEAYFQAPVFNFSSQQTGFSNIPQIPIKQKPVSSKPQAKEQQYIKLYKGDSGQYHRLIDDQNRGNRRSLKSCDQCCDCNADCCDAQCVGCCLQCLCMMICEIIARA